MMPLRPQTDYGRNAENVAPSVLWTISIGIAYFACIAQIVATWPNVVPLPDRFTPGEA
jgi:hypothetical protein